MAAKKKKKSKAPKSKRVRKATLKTKPRKRRKPAAAAKKKKSDPFGSIEELDRLMAAYKILEFGQAIISPGFSKLVTTYVKLSMLGEKPPPLDEGASPVDRDVDSYAQELAEMVIRTATAVKDEPVSFEGKTLIEVLGEKPKFQQTAEQMRERERKLQGKMLVTEIDEGDYQAWLGARAQ